MVINEFECELLRDGYYQYSTQPDIIQDEADPIKRVNSWELLFPEVIQDVNATGDSSNKLTVPGGHENLGLHCKSFSLSSGSSSEDAVLFDIGLGGNNKPTPSRSASLESDTNNQGLKNETSNNPHAKEHDEISSINSTSPMHKPPVQIMERDEDYDPQRIPSSVFARNDSLTPAEWSTASNESLFSLHVGNASIDRDKADMLTGDLKKLIGMPKSGELFTEELKEELRRLTGLSKSGEFFMPSPPPPTIPEVEHEGEIPEIENLQEKIVALIEPKKETPKTVLEKKNEQKPTRSSSVSRQSDGSEESTCSFAFPILGGSGKKTTVKGPNHQQQSQQQTDAPKPVVTLTPILPDTKSNGGRFCSTCFSWIFCSSCRSCSYCSYKSFYRKCC